MKAISEYKNSLKDTVVSYQETVESDDKIEEEKYEDSNGSCTDINLVTFPLNNHSWQIPF